MSAVLSRLAEDQPADWQDVAVWRCRVRAGAHPPWCETVHGDEHHVGRYVQAENVGVLVVQSGDGLAHVILGGREYLPEDARAFAGLLSVLGHAVLAACITRAVEMAEL